MYPINLDLTGQTVLVVGGGKVAFRKINRLITTDAQIIVISPNLVEKLAKLIASQSQIEYQQREFVTEDLTTDLALVFAATDDQEVNYQIANLAHQKNILVNSVTSAEESSFTLPSMVKRGKLLLTIATCGTAPALSKRLRKELEQDFGDEYALFLELMEEIRPLVIKEIADEEQRRKILNNLVNLDIIELLRDNKEQAIVRLKERLPQKVVEKSSSIFSVLFWILNLIVHYEL